MTRNRWLYVVLAGLVCADAYAIGIGMTGMAKKQGKEVAKEKALVNPVEKITTPGAPSGPTRGTAGVSYDYTASGSTSSLGYGHVVEYRFNWGDGTSSAWSTGMRASHVWSTAGTYFVSVKVRCHNHAGVVAVSPALSVVISNGETIGVPNTPNSACGTYTTGGSTSSLGHTVEYRFNWGDGTYSLWGTGTSASHSWSMAGTYSVFVEARCQIDTGVTAVSTAMNVAIGEASGIITTYAGTGAVWPAGGYSGDGGPAASAQLNNLRGLTSDSFGNMYIADYSNNRVRLVNGSGIITTVAGTGPIGYLLGGYGGDGGPATSAKLNTPSNVMLDGSGNLYISDNNNHCIRKVDKGTGIITTVAGIGGSKGYSGDGGPATNAQLFWPHGIAMDGSGNLYIADYQNNRIRKVTASTGIITTVAGAGPVGEGTGGYGGDGGLAINAQLYNPWGLALDSSGNLYIGDYRNHRIRKVTVATGIITTVAGTGGAGRSGDGGPATSAQIGYPAEIKRDICGNLFIVENDVNSCIRKMDGVTGIITTVAGVGGRGYSGDGGPAISAQLDWPSGVTVDGSGNVYIGDAWNNRVRKVTP